MKSGDRATRNSDKAERKNLPGENRPGAIGESCDSRKLQVRTDHKNAQAKHQHHSQFHESAQIVTRRKQHPYRKGAGDKATDFTDLLTRHLAERFAVAAYRAE